MKVLFVCTGNLCRSPVAEKLLAAERLPGVETRSRGLAAQPYLRTPRQVSAFLLNCGVKDPSHKPSLLAEDDVNWADLILVMEERQAEALEEKFPQAGRKLHLMLAYCAGKPGDLDDPMGGSDTVFERVLGIVRYCVKELARKLSPPTP